MKTNTHILRMLLTSYVVLVSFSCEDFVRVDLPRSQITNSSVYEKDETAIAAASGMYASMLQIQGFIGGVFNPISYLGGLSSDELIDYTGTAPYAEFYNNALNINNSVVLYVWSTGYNTIYEANAVIEGLEASSTITGAVKMQLEGEAKFVRAFCHFYLVNLFGDVPIVTTTDYKQNAILPRTPAIQVYDKVVSDLKDAQNLLTDEYFTTERTRPNKGAASAMLARVYLYMKDYSNAESAATSVINTENTYSLVPDLNQVFLANSNEAIWQLTQVAPLPVPTGDGFAFIGSSSTSLSAQLISAFETSDFRIESWVTQNNSSYLPNKYKVRFASPPYTEYLTVLRLAEMFLIRAESRAKQNNIVGAQDDLNEIRNRAGLDNTSANDQPTLLDAICHERRIELFCEFGHRWLDLKRTNAANDVLGPIKPSWNATDAYYPIPESEMLNNPQLKPQNNGY